MAHNFLLADVGGTNSTWVLNSNNRVLEFQAGGFNPYVSADKELGRVLNDEVIPKLEGKPEQLFYYGAGCAAQEQKERVQAILESSFTNVFVESDLVGAGRALFGNEEGVAIILGTGMSACQMRQGQMNDMMPALGYLLGDEGSGADIGKHFLKAHFQKELPKELSAEFSEQIGVTDAELLRTVYAAPIANKKLASFLPFIKAHLANDALHELVVGRFRNMLELVVTHFGNEQFPIGVVGSVGFHFKELLKKVAAEFGLDLNKVLQDPMAELLSYHSERLS